MAFLLVGGDSEIASATRALLDHQGVRSSATTRRPDLAARSGRTFLDLAAPVDAWDPPAGTTTACIFAAIARLQDCARDPVGSARINVENALTLARRLSDRGIYVLFLSTNQVFDGNTPWVPTSTPLSPVSEYGRQKARSEIGFQEMMQAGAPVGILRLSKIVSPDMALLRDWETALRAGRGIRAFRDMQMAPVPTQIVAEAIVALLAERRSGIWQLSGPNDVSYAQIGEYIARHVGAPRHLVEPVATVSAGMPEGSTPRHTTFDTSALRECFGISVPAPWPVINAVMGWRD